MDASGPAATLDDVAPRNSEAAIEILRPIELSPRARVIETDGTTKTFCFLAQ
jgi:hypothetical protein